MLVYAYKNRFLEVKCTVRLLGGILYLGLSKHLSEHCTDLGLR